jgi:acyl dehydratase
MKTEQVETKKMKQVFFDDVQVGSEIMPLTKRPLSRSIMALFGAVMGDFCPLHFDYRFAKEEFNYNSPVAYGLQLGVYLSQLVTDWIGPNGRLKKFACQTLNPACDGESLTMQGKVTKKYVKDGENYVECEIWGGTTQDGKVAEVVNVLGSATVTLPSKRSKS